MPGTFLLVGKPGSGKTTTACTLEHPTLIIDVDCKAEGMANLYPLVAEKLVEIIPIRIPLVSEKLSDRALYPQKGVTIQPRGYLAIVDLLNEILEDNEGKYERFRTIVLDSITRTTEHMKRLLIYLKSSGAFGESKKKKDDITDDMNWPSWGSYLSNLEELFTEACQLSGKNLICTVHEETRTEHDKFTDTTVILGYWPMIHGQMREKVSGYFNEVYYMLVEGGKGKPTNYFCRTRGNKIDAHSSFKDIPDVVEADLGKVMEKYGGWNK